MSVAPTAPDPVVHNAALRRAPAAPVLARLCSELRLGGRVAAVRRLRGGISCGMHAIDLVGPDGDGLRLVVRRYNAEHARDDPDVAAREWAALTALARVEAPTPRPIWLDADGAVFGHPTIVVSRLPGRGLLVPRNQDTWIRELARALAGVHRAALTEAELALLADQRAMVARRIERGVPPAGLLDRPHGAEVWRAYRRLWPRVAAGWPAAPTLVHGDYWPGNTLWRYGRLTGVVDWEQAARGTPAHDVGYCRVDLAHLSGQAASDAFLRAYESASGHSPPFLAFWDLRAAMSAMVELEHWVVGYHDLGRADVTVVVARERLDRFVADALARADRAVDAT